MSTTVEQHQAARRHATEIAQYLPGWHVEPPESDNQWYARLLGPHGERLQLSVIGRHGERLNIDAYLLHPLNGHKAYDDHLPEISVAHARGAKTIAAEIQRRILPQYEPILARAKANLAKSQQAEQNKETSTTNLARILGVTSDKRLYLRVKGGDYSSVKFTPDYDGTDCKITMDVSIERAVEIARLVATWERKDD